MGNRILIAICYLLAGLIVSRLLVLAPTAIDRALVIAVFFVGTGVFLRWWSWRQGFEFTRMRCSRKSGRQTLWLGLAFLFAGTGWTAAGAWLMDLKSPAHQMIVFTPAACCFLAAIVFLSVWLSTQIMRLMGLAAQDDD